jgi:hypothetical protein
MTDTDQGPGTSASRAVRPGGPLVSRHRSARNRPPRPELGRKKW